MPEADLTIRNGTIVTSQLWYKAGIALKGGKIFSITSTENLPRAEKSIDASGLYILPGIIDAHVHLRDPGFTYKEDFRTGTSAAAAGGVTCVFDMPNNDPPVKDAKALKEKLESIRGKAVVDYGLYGLLNAGNLSDLADLSRGGVIGYKCFLGETLGKVEPPSDGEKLQEFAEVVRLCRRISIHAENDSIVRHRIADLRGEGRADPRAHYESRPEVVEEEAVNRVVDIAREAGCKIHIAHVSSRKGADAIRRAQYRGDEITAETCPHYLLLDETNYGELGSLMKANPAIKTPSDKEALWEALDDGTIGMIASDHAPQTGDEKRQPRIFDCLSGISGLETMVPLMLTQVNRGRLSLTQYVKLSSENPARIWGIHPRKGCIAVGSDADFTIVDLKKVGRVEADKFLSKAKWSPFDGYEVEGMPEYTLVRGNVVMEGGNIDSRPYGELASPTGI